MWLPIAVLGVGVVSALLATFDQPGVGLVITGVVAGLTALTALTVRPAIAEGGVSGDGANTSRNSAPSGKPGPGHTPGTTEGATSGVGSAGDDPSRTPEAPATAVENDPTGKAGAEDGQPRSEEDPRDGAAAVPDGTEDDGAGTEPEATEAEPEDEGPSTAGAADTTGAQGNSETAESAPGSASPEPEPHRYAWSAVYGVLATALLCTAVFRDAGWVLLWTLTASFLLASMAFAARNPSSRQDVVGVITGALSLFRNLPSTPQFLTEPLRGARSRHLVGPVLLTTTATVGLLLVFGLLFTFADAVFASYLRQVFSGRLLDTVVFNVFGDLFAMATAILLTGAAVLSARRRHVPRPAPRPAPPNASRDRTPPPVWVWTIPLGALLLLFTAFLAVQAVAMFGGDDHVQRVAGMTYAEYARQGFFQLVVVSVLVLCVIAVAVRVLPSQPTATRTLRNTLLGLLCVLTLVILASAMMRLQLYTDTFGLTRLRATAEAWILWSAGVFGLVCVAGVLNTLGRSASWMPRVTVAFSGIALALFAYGNPDLRIAQSHHDLDLSVIDTWYLQDLSADAVPGLMELEGDDRVCALMGFQGLLEDSDGTGFASWNLSRHQGRQRLAELDLFGTGGQAQLECSYRYGY